VERDTNQFIFILFFIEKVGRADFMGVWGRSESKGERRREKRSNPKRRWRLLLIVIVYCIDWVLIVG